MTRQRPRLDPATATVDEMSTEIRAFLRRRNPLLAAWQKYQEPIAIDWRLMLDAEAQLRRRARLDRRLNDVHAGMRAWMMRERAVRRWAWGIPTDEALRTIAKYAPIVEVGAGTGYWAHLLRRDYDVTVRAYDRHPPPSRHNGWHRTRRRFAPVLVGGARKAKQFPDHALFLCWPPMSSMAADALHHYRGAHVIYVGEQGGCTADDAFFAALDRDWIEIEDVTLPQWEGIHDRLEVWRRR